MRRVTTDAELCDLCAAAYGDGISGAVVDVQPKSLHGPRAFVLHDGPDLATVVIRGTADHEGWATDLDAARHGYDAAGSVWVHDGFYAYWRELRYKIIPACTGRRVTIAGHSLGGALATLCAMDLLPAQVERVVTFGSPRVGDAGFALRYGELAKRTARYVHLFDPVPWLPGVMGGYRHVCPSTWYDGAIWREWSWPAYAITAAVDLACSGVYNPARWWRDVGELIGHHLVTSYQAAMPHGV
jgi:pimeloyl-ACP methyl ester carboxylesterase